MPEKRVRVGIIGAGWAGQAHARFYAKVPFVDVVAWADAVPGKAAAAATTYSVPDVYDDYEPMLKRDDIDAVSVATYNMGHRQPTVDCLTAGKHVLLEKPMAATLSDAQAIMRCWEKHQNQILMVGFQPIFSQEHQAAKKVFEAGTLGDVYYAEAITHRRWGVPGGNFIKAATAGAGTLVDTGVYAIHNALWLMGDPKPVAVSGSIGKPLVSQYRGVRETFAGPWTGSDVEVEEFAFAWVRFESGAVLLVKSTWAANADDLGRPFFLGTLGGLALRPLEVFVNGQWPNLNATTQVNVNRVEEDREASWTAKMHNFAAAVRDGQPSPIDPRGVFLVNVIMDGIFRSASEGREVEVSAAY